MRPKARIQLRLASAFMPLARRFWPRLGDAAAGFVFVCSSAAVTTCITARLRRGTIGAKELQNTTLHYKLDFAAGAPLTQGSTPSQ